MPCISEPPASMCVMVLLSSVLLVLERQDGSLRCLWFCSVVMGLLAGYTFLLLGLSCRATGQTTFKGLCGASLGRGAGTRGGCAEPLVPRAGDLVGLPFWESLGPF